MHQPTVLPRFHLKPSLEILIAALKRVLTDDESDPVLVSRI